MPTLKKSAPGATSDSRIAQLRPGLESWKLAFWKRVRGQPRAKDFQGRRSTMKISSSVWRRVARWGLRWPLVAGASAQQQSSDPPYQAPWPVARLPCCGGRRHSGCTGAATRLTLDRATGQRRCRQTGAGRSHNRDGPHCRRPVEAAARLQYEVLPPRTNARSPREGDKGTVFVGTCPSTRSMRSPTRT